MEPEQEIKSELISEIKKSVKSKKGIENIEKIFKEKFRYLLTINLEEKM